MSTNPTARLVTDKPKFAIRSILTSGHFFFRRAKRSPIAAVPIGRPKNLRGSRLSFQATGERFEWHYTPKHGSWLDLAESELGRPNVVPSATTAASPTNKPSSRKSPPGTRQQCKPHHG